MFNHTFLQSSYATHLNGADPLDPRVNLAQADLSNMPATLIQVAGGELFLDQVNVFAERAKASGVDVTLECFDAQFHVFQTLMHSAEDTRKARASLAQFAQKMGG